MSTPNRRKDDPKEESPIVQLYWAIADLFGHRTAAEILEIILKEES